MVYLQTAVILSAIAVSSATALPSGGAATATHGSEQYVRTTRQVVDSLRPDLDQFHLRLTYHGPNPTKYPLLQLSVDPSAAQLAESTTVRIDKDEAAVLLGYLAGDGFLYRGATNRVKFLAPPKGPYFFLLVQCNEQDQYYEFLPLTKESYRWHWMDRPPLVDQLDGLRSVLEGTAAEALDQIVRVLREVDSQAQKSAAR